MNRVILTDAKAVFYPGAEAERDRTRNAVTHYGFHHAFVCAAPERAEARIAARNAYRLYINGETVMHGPARTAHGYARVDVANVGGLLKPGENHIAVEVVSYGDFYKGYSNSTTLEPGLLTFELEADGRVVSATGRDGWQVCRLPYRAARGERIAHSRECCEIVRLGPDCEQWRMGCGAGFVPAEPCAEPVYLGRRSPLPTLARHNAHTLVEFGACRLDPGIPLAGEFWNRDDYNPAGYCDSLDDRPMQDVRRTVEADGPVFALRDGDAVTLTGEGDRYALFDLGESHVGFIGVELTAQRAGVVDVVRCETLELDGGFRFPHNLVTRLYVPAGRTGFTAMEPGVARYLKVIFRGTGDVTLHRLSMVEYTTPDRLRGSFLCSSGEINRLYRSACRTLTLNTLDIFMDCPDRERGGWLCDSLWTARAAAMLLCDDSVEKDFLENFLLTPPEGMSNAFFPETYPASKRNYPEDTGISTWSFWLMCQLCEYVRRTGDRAFAAEHAARVEAFVNGSGGFIGESGLIEGLEGMFIDWSLSNRPEYLEPVSVPANALYAFMLVELGDLYDRPDWRARGGEMRRILREGLCRNTGGDPRGLTALPDQLVRDGEGRLCPGGYASESGIATALWSGLFAPAEIPALMRGVRDCMGPAPRFPADPNIGKSGLFIGLCIRLDMLCRMGAHGRMFEDMKAIYLPQLEEGPGTLWEHSVIDSASCCHGFNAHAGVHLLRDVLGMGMPVRAQDGVVRLTIAPHPCGLRWAKGAVQLPEGLLSVCWKYDGDSFELDVRLPAGNGVRFLTEVCLPREAKALEPEAVRVRIR